MLTKYRSFAVFVILLLFVSVLRADSVDDLIKSEMQRQKIPGISLAVLKNGKVVKTQGYGLANVELNVPATPDTVFKIGSVSKQFIASGIMLLVADGKVGLDDKIGKYFDGSPQIWKDITVRHLLTHTSGLVRESPGFDPQKIQSDADVIKAAYASPLQFAPGEKYQYCNLGYFILAEITHKVSAKTWGDFLNERIFAKLGMSSTHVTSETDIFPNRASGYRLEDGKIYNAPNYTAVRPSGAFVSNVVDLAKWESALYTESVLKESARAQMWTPATLNDGRKNPYGFGWDLNDFRGTRTIQHGGILNGFLSQYLRFPDHGLTIIILSNFRHGNIDRIAKGVMTKYVSGSDLAGIKPKNDPNPETTQLHKKLLEDFANDVKDLPQTTVEFNTALAAMPPASRTAPTEQIKKQTSFVFLTKIDVSGKGIVRGGTPIETIWSYRSSAPGKTTFFTFYTTTDKKVAHFEPSDY